MSSVGPRLDEVELELASLSELRDKPSGTIRLTSTDYGTDTILWPKLLPLLLKYPEIKIEIITDYGLTDIVTQRYDAGARPGEQVAKDMVALRRISSTTIASIYDCQPSAIAIEHLIRRLEP